MTLPSTGFETRRRTPRCAYGLTSEVEGDRINEIFRPMVVQPGSDQLSLAALNHTSCRDQTD